MRKRLYNLSMIESNINAGNFVKARVKSLYIYLLLLWVTELGSPPPHTPTPTTAATGAHDSLTEIPAHSSHLALNGRQKGIHQLSSGRA